MSVNRTISRLLDRSACPEVHIAGRVLSTFQICGLAGFALSAGASIALAPPLGLSRMVMIGVVAIAAITFFVVALGTKALTGSETLVYYHHELAIAASTSAYVFLLGQPVLRHLDVSLLAMAVFLVFGRIGCFMVGCCHGRPHRFGVSYGEAHVRAGLSRRLAGVRLFPIQLAESLLALLAVAGGVLSLAYDAPPGAVAAWQGIVYGVGRFVLERARGDRGRPYHLGLSEAQWISCVLLFAISIEEIAGVLPLRAWHIGAILVVMLAAARAIERPERRVVPARASGHQLDRIAILPVVERDRS